MDFNLFDDHHEHFAPLSFTRPLGALRIGIGTIAEKWQIALGGNAGFDTRDSLQTLFPGNGGDLHICGRLLPNEHLVDILQRLKSGETLVSGDEVLAFRGTKTSNTVQFSSEALLLHHPTDLFTHNDAVLRADFKANTAGKISRDLPEHCVLIGPDDQLFIEDGAKLLACTLNTTEGPIYIGKNAVVMEGCLVRGPFAIGEQSTLKMGAKIYGATTIGPHCKVGGEVSNSVFQGYSNKAHDGFLGNSVIGEWCNLGADTNTSNLKNNYGSVRLWDYGESDYYDSGLTFCGLVMGDHSKSAINTQFNTGTTVGAYSNIFGAGFPPKFIPSFSWGGAEGFSTFDFNKALDVARRVKARRSHTVSDDEIEVMRHIFHQSARFRTE